MIEIEKRVLRLRDNYEFLLAGGTPFDSPADQAERATRHESILIWDQFLADEVLADVRRLLEWQKA
jgi:hypothetical protein